MYLISYQKRNGDIICRVRNTMPQYALNRETSMGWKVVDIKQRFKGSYYSIPEWNKLSRKNIKKQRFIRKINKLFKEYATKFVMVIIIAVLLYK